MNRNGSVTDGITTTITGTFGQSQTLSGKLGFSGETPTGEVGGDITQSYETSHSVSYSHSQTWETKEWYLYNKSGGNSAEWAADFTDNKTYVQSATVQTKLSSEWIWRVKKDFAVKHSTLQQCLHDNEQSDMVPDKRGAAVRHRNRDRSGGGLPVG